MLSTKTPPVFTQEDRIGEDIFENPKIFSRPVFYHPKDIILNILKSDKEEDEN
jgi:hypothetical protein